MPSQNNEDEIIQIICERCGFKNGFFVEIGCDPHENNTSALEARGWHGVRYDKKGGVGVTQRLIRKDNASKCVGDAYHAYRDSIRNNKYQVIDFILSVDVDGIDYDIVESILKDWGTPSLLVVEYNASKGSDVNYSMPYDPDYEWTGGDEYGASLKSWVALLSGRMGLVDTNGVNAFFVSMANVARYYFKPLPECHRPALRG